MDGTGAEASRTEPDSAFPVGVERAGTPVRVVVQPQRRRVRWPRWARLAIGLWLTFCFLLMSGILAAAGAVWLGPAIAAALALLYVVTRQRFHSYRDHGWISVGPEHLATRSFGGRVRVIRLTAPGTYALYTHSLLNQQRRSMGPELILMGSMKRRLLVFPSKRRKRLFRMPTAFYLRDDVQRVADALPVPVHTFDILDHDQLATNAPGSVAWAWRHPAVFGLLTGVTFLVVAGVLITAFGSNH